MHKLLQVKQLEVSCQRLLWIFTICIPAAVSIPVRAATQRIA